MRAAVQSLRVFLQSHDEPGHVRDRIHAQMRFRTMRGFSLNANTESQTTFRCHDEPQRSRFGNHGRVGAKSFAKLHYAAIGVFLIGRSREDNFAPRLNAILRQRRDRMHHGRHTRFGVACAASI